MRNEFGDEPEKGVEAQEESRLKRWSQRKARVRAETLNKDDDLISEVAEKALPEAKQAEPEPPSEQQQELTDEDMPAIESLDESSDLSPFFSPKVSANLRRLALRKIFHLPVYNIRDGLNDYDEDYTVFEPLGDVITADMRHMQEIAEKRRREKELLAEIEAEKQKQIEAKTDDVASGQGAGEEHQAATGMAEENPDEALAESVPFGTEDNEERRDDDGEKPV